MVELYFLGALFVTHLVMVYLVAAKCANAMNDVLDSLSKLSQLGMVNQKAKTAIESVEAQVALDREIRALDKAEEEMEREIKANKGRPTGFRDATGRIIRFMTPPDEKMLARIPEDRLIYN